MIYFVRWPDRGYIKIGYTNNVPYRMKTLEAEYGVAFELLAVIEGGRKEEKALHRRFVEHRCYMKATFTYRRELFHPGKELMEFIVGISRAEGKAEEED